MDLGLKNRVAIILAASKGLGKSAALQFAREGCKVAICSRNKENLDTAVKEIKNAGATDVFGQTVDVESWDKLERFIKEVAARWSNVDILVNNAGGPPVARFENSTDEEWLKWYNITFMSVVRASKVVLPFMKKNRWGRIINITSISVKQPVENLIYSNALRLAVVGLAKSMSRELGADGITVNNVAPGYHMTEGFERIIVKKVQAGIPRPQVLEQYEKSIPVKRIGDPGDLAGMIVFLASDAASYITGATIQVDGGSYSGTL